MIRAAALLGLSGCFFTPPAPSGTTTAIGDATLADSGATSDVIIPATTNLMFVTSTTRAAASLMGTVAADMQCQDLANAAARPGTFKALLSTSTESARQRLGGSNGWVRPDGRMFAASIDALMQNEVLHPPVLDETGTTVGAEIVITGTNQDLAPTGNDCDDLLGGGNELISSGIASATQVEWANKTGVMCDVQARLYCFQIDNTTVLTPQSTVGRIVFLSTAWQPSNGRSDADAHCNADTVGINGLAGKSFIALLADDGEAATARLDPLGPPWVRTDGVIVAMSTAAVEQGAIFTSISVTADRTYVNNPSVYTGALGPAVPGDAASTCDSWRNQGMNAVTGGAVRTDAEWFSQVSRGCDVQRRVYCFENGP